MQKYLMAAISIVILAIAVFLTIRSSRRKSRSQTENPELGSLIDLTALQGTPLVAAKGQYVATVFRDKPLERVVTGGLMYRGKAQLVVTDRGVGIERLGEESFAIPAELILEVGRSSATIDRSVEADGLLSISWLLGATEVITQLRLDRVDDTEELAKALKQLVEKDGAR